MKKNIILKSPSFIKYCIEQGYIEEYNRRGYSIWISQLYLRDLNALISDDILGALEKREQIHLYKFTGKDIEIIHEIFREYNKEITFEEASCIYMPQRLGKDCVIIDDGKVFVKICQTKNIKTCETRWLLKTTMVEI